MMLHSMRPASCTCRPPVVTRSLTIPVRKLRVAVFARQGQDQPEKAPGTRRRSSSASKGPNKADDTPSPAVQLADNLANSSNTSSTPDTPSPAAQVASNLADRGSSSSTPSPAVQQANTLYEQQQSPGGDAGNPRSPADLVNEGIKAAAGSAEDAINRSAVAAKDSITAATDLTTQGISAAEAAAEETVRTITTAAEGTLNAAASVVGGVAGAVDGAVTGATSSTNRNRKGGSSNNGVSPTSTGSFDSVNVRVPANMAWANATPAKGRIRDMTLTQDFDEDEVEAMKVNILAAVASLDRGLAANVREASDVDKLCRKLEDTAGPVTLKWQTSRSSPDASTMDKLSGTWRLIYSSGFNGGSLGGSRPGPPAALVPTILGQVYQVIDADKGILDNVVELLLAYGVPQLPFLPRSDPQPTPGVRLTLRHTYEVTQPNNVKICFESTAAKAIGPELLQNLPQFGVPELPDFLKPPKDLRSASFDVTYLDTSMRITRGDRGELRIYLKDKPLEAAAPADYVD